MADKKKPDKNKNTPNTNFKEISQPNRTSILAEFWFFLKHNKKWWMLPILIILLLLGLLIVLGGTAIAPFIYPIF